MAAHLGNIGECLECKAKVKDEDGNKLIVMYCEPSKITIFDYNKLKEVEEYTLMINRQKIECWFLELFNVHHYTILLQITTHNIRTFHFKTCQNNGLNLVIENVVQLSIIFTLIITVRQYFSDESI